eukprot:1261989-Karenia_brevis.AAC.1
MGPTRAPQRAAAPHGAAAHSSSKLRWPLISCSRQQALLKHLEEQQRHMVPLPTPRASCDGSAKDFHIESQTFPVHLIQEALHRLQLAILLAH